MAEWDIEDVVDRESLEKWLVKAPMKVERVYLARQLAMRSALRAFPNGMLGYKSEGEYRQRGYLTLQCFRAIFVAWAAQVYRDPTMKLRADSAASRADSAAFSSVSHSTDLAVHCAARFAETAADSAEDSAAFCAAAAAASAADSIAYIAIAVTNSTARSAVWTQVQKDLVELSSATPKGSSVIPLWFPEVLRGKGGPFIAEVIQTNVSAFQRDIVAKHAPWGLLLDWYAHMETGTNESFFGEEADLKIALADDDWWERQPDDVMADIAAMSKQSPSLSQLVSPQVALDEAGRLDAQPNADFDVPDVDEELLSLPEEQMAYLRVLKAALAPRQGSANAFSPVTLVGALGEYETKLIAGGLQPDLGSLKGLFSIMEIGAAQLDKEKAWPDPATQATWHKIAETHGKILDRYPLDPKRMAEYEKYRVDTASLPAPEISDLHSLTIKSMREARSEGFTTDEYLAALQALGEQAKVLNSVPDTASAELTEKVEQAKKTNALRSKGFADATIERANKVTKLVESDTVQLALRQLRSWGDAIGKFISGG